MKKLLKNASWISPEGALESGSIIIDRQKINLVSECVIDDFVGEIFDCRERLILPGIIDPHVHFREPGEMKKEGIENGCLAAIKGGVTTILDMPNNRPPCTTRRRWETKCKLFKRKSPVNWGLHFHAGLKMDENIPGNIAAVKIYMAKSSQVTPITTIDELGRIFAMFPRISIHAEDETCFKNAATLNPTRHHHIRPKKSILSALEKISAAYGMVPEKRRPRLIMCHISTREEIDWIRQKKSENWKVAAETCPHYLYFTQADLEKKGGWYKVNPPLRTEEDRESLIEGLKDGTIDFIGSDHAPHLPADKISASNPPSGMASIEWLGPLMLKLVDDGTIAWKRYSEISVKNTAEIYDIKLRDGLRNGNYADLIVISRSGEFASDSPIITKTDFDPYSDFKYSRRIESVMVNGEWVKIDGKYTKNKKGMEAYGKS